MRTLKQILQENIYGNLGIDKDVEQLAFLDWAKNYADSVADKQDLADSNMTFNNKNNIPIVDGKSFIINTDPKYEVAPNGELPDYCKDLKFMRYGIDLWVYSDKRNPLRSFKNIPSALKLDVENYTNCIHLFGEYDTLDFSDIKCKIEIGLGSDFKVNQITGLSNVSDIYFFNKITLDKLNDILRACKDCDFTTKGNFDSVARIAKISRVRKNGTVKISNPKQLAEYIKLVQEKTINLKYLSLSSEILSEPYHTWHADGGYCIDLSLENDIWANYKISDTSFLSAVDPKKVKYIKLPECYLTEKDLENLPEGVVLIITWPGHIGNRNKNLKEHYDNITDYSVIMDSYSGYIFIKK